MQKSDQENLDQTTEVKKDLIPSNWEDVANLRL